MNWEMFLGGFGLIIGAFLIRRFDRWFYRKVDAEVDSYNYFQWMQDKIISIVMIVVGLIVIFASFAP